MGDTYTHGSKRGYYSLKHEGFYNLNDILKDLKNKLKNLKYDIIDKEHSESNGNAGREEEFAWNCSKDVTEYIKFKIEMKILTLHQIDVMVEKKKMQKGDFELRVTAIMSSNYNKSFKTTRAGKIKAHLYEKLVIAKKLESSEDNLKEEVKIIIDLIKNHLY